jgi:hypothetical protein
MHQEFALGFHDEHIGVFLSGTGKIFRFFAAVEAATMSSTFFLTTSFIKPPCLRDYAAALHRGENGF